MDEKKVYVVTSGEYSDYGIKAVFDDIDKAQQYIDLHKKYGNGISEINDDIEEYILNSSVPSVRPIYYVEIDSKGNVERQYTQPYESDEPYEEVHYSKYCKTISAESDRGYDVALKIARDKLGMIKAMENGI